MPNKGALVLLDQQHYDGLVNIGVDAQKLRLVDSSLTGIQNEHNVIVNLHGSDENNGKLVIGRKYRHPINIIQASRLTTGGATDSNNIRCFDMFACHIGVGIQSSDSFLKERLGSNNIKRIY